MICFFLGYFALFAFVLYPNNQYFALSGVAKFLTSILPEGYRGFVTMIEYWHASIFYVLCELWSSAIMFVLFWGFMNETTSMEDASKSYAIYNFFGNAAAIAGGVLITRLKLFDLKSLFRSLNLENLISEVNICNCFYVNIFICIVLGLVAVVLFRVLTVLKKGSTKLDPKILKPKKDKKDQEKYGFFESILLVVKSQYLFCLLTLVVAYNAVFVWHDTLFDQTLIDFFKSDRALILDFQGNTLIYKGIFSCLFALITPALLAVLGWRRVALMTPVILLGSSLVFFL